MQVSNALKVCQKNLKEKEEAFTQLVTSRAVLQEDLNRLLHGKQSLDDIKNTLLKQQQTHAAKINQLDQEFASQQLGGGGARQHINANHFKENQTPNQQSFQPMHSMPVQYKQQQQQYPTSFNDPRAHLFPTTSAVGATGRPLNFSASVGEQYPRATMQQYQQPQQQQQHPLSSSQGRQRANTGDAGLDSQPKPLWFRKLAQ